MPARKGAANGAAPKKKGGKAYKMPDPIPQGEMLRDIFKKEWTLGPSIGVGGFGEIYLASNGGKAEIDKASHVIKIEPAENGPLFVELHFYQRAAKEAKVENWKKSHKMSHLGIPKYIGSGQHTHGNTTYRFMVMSRFGEDIWKKFLKCDRKFNPKTAYTLAIQIIDALEYLHENEYVHADIKGANLLLGYGPKAQDQVYLVDFGLAQRFNPEGRHKEYKEDPRKAHDGTAEYTSRDAHKGVLPSRRGDMEILGYVLVQWLCGKLPWEDKLKDLNYLTQQKEKYMADPKLFLKTCFPEGGVDELRIYLEFVRDMKYTDKPDYKKVKDLFKKAIQKSGAKYDGKLDFKTAAKRKSSSPARDSSASPPVKRKAVKGAGDRKPRGRPIKKKSEEESSSSGGEVKSPVRAKVSTPRKNLKSPARGKGTPRKETIASPAVKRKVAARNMSEDEDIGKSPARGRQTPSKRQGSTKTHTPCSVKKARTVKSSDAETQTTPGLKSRRTKKKKGAE